MIYDKVKNRLLLPFKNNNLVESKLNIIVIANAAEAIFYK